MHILPLVYNYSSYLKIRSAYLVRNFYVCYLHSNLSHGKFPSLSEFFDTYHTTFNFTIRLSCGKKKGPKTASITDVTQIRNRSQPVEAVIWVAGRVTTMVTTPTISDKNEMCSYDNWFSSFWY
jgi:hypothetical protein